MLILLGGCCCDVCASVTVPEDLEFYDPKDITAEFGALTTALQLPTDFGTIQSEIREWADYAARGTRHVPSLCYISLLYCPMLTSRNLYCVLSVRLFVRLQHVDIRAVCPSSLCCAAPDRPANAIPNLVPIIRQ